MACSGHGNEGLIMRDLVIHINMDSKCAECGSAGATPSGICMKCATKAMKPDAVMKSAHGKAVQSRYVKLFSDMRKRIEDCNNG